jgi:pyridoxamine 5'-phosphate oxidase
MAAVEHPTECQGRRSPQYGKLDTMAAVEHPTELQAQLRELKVFEGELARFDPSDVPAHPAELFLLWLQEAVEGGEREPHAMTLSTVDGEGRPSSRVLILKGLSDGRWEFATSRRSRKGRELEGNGWGAMSFYWSLQGRQVRIRGRVLAAGDERSAADFLARSRGARAEALAGVQSEVLGDQAELDAALEEASRRIARAPDVVAEEWTVYGLAADEIEFWQAHPERRHVRLRYRLCDGVWITERLWP